MQRILVVTLVVAACSTAPVNDLPDAGHVPDAGDAPDAGAEELALPERPSLEELARWWDEKMLCRLYACAERVHETTQTCALAQAATGAPYDTFRHALASVRAGRATYDANAGARCAAFLRTVDLSADCFGASVTPYREAYGVPFVSLCTDLVDGTVTDGGACDDERECVTGAGCVFDRSEACAGTCVLWLKAGESCAERFRDCAPSTYCDGSVCKSRALAPDGSRCFDDGASCQSGKCFDNECRTTSQFNGECIGRDDCDPGLFCRPLPPSTGRLGICQQPVFEGTACGYTVQCAGNQSCDGYFRKNAGGWTEGTCGGRPQEIGESCIPLAEGYDFGDTGCFMDLTCEPATATCVAAPAIGAACATPGNRCGFAAYCDGEGICRAKKSAGAAAESAAECADDFDSFEQVCYRRSDRERCGRL